MVDLDRIAAIRERLAAANLGACHAERDDFDEYTGQICDGDGNYVAWVSDNPEPGDSPLIEFWAGAPADLAFLLAELDRLREVERAARDVLDDINRSLPDWETCDGCENDEPRKRLVALRAALEGTDR